MAVELPFKLPNQAFALLAHGISHRKLRRDSLKFYAISRASTLMVAENIRSGGSFLFPGALRKHFPRIARCRPDKLWSARFYKVKWMQKPEKIERFLFRSQEGGC